MARPSRKSSSRLLSSLSFVFFLFIALIFLCPPAVSAEDKKSEYGTVIGIGTSSFFFFLFLSFFL
jgi:endoplasmic reticulum chaperone BiP